jgi:hypothetical protein
MFRVVIFVIAIVGIFAGTLAYGGERLGTWDEAEPPPPSNLQPITRPEEKKDEGGSASSVAGDGAPTEKLSPDKVRWIRQANTLCRRAADDMGDYEQPETLGEAEQLIVELQAKNKQYNDAFAAIPPAKGDRRVVAQLLELLDKDERLVASLLTALREGDAGAVVELNERLTSVAQRESEILVGLGATDCDVGLVAPTY